MTTCEILFTIGGWLMGFIAAIGSNYILERRRAFRAVVGACRSVESRLAGTTDVHSLHKWSITILESPFFTGIGFLSFDEQDKASEAWGRYHNFDAAQYPDDDVVGGAAVILGEADATKPAALKRELSLIRTIFNKAI